MDVDLAIVGGGPAGLVLALVAAEAGLSTRVLERRASPLDKACGEGVMPQGLEVLEGLGVTARLLPGDCSRIEGIRYLQEDGAHFEALLPGPGGLGVRRTALISALTQQALARGVRIDERCAVREVLFEPGRVRVLWDTGELSARMVVAADGLHSPLRKLLRLQLPTPARGRRYGLRQHFRLAPWTRHVEVYFARGVEAYVTPVGADRIGVAFLWEQDAAKGRVDFQKLLAAFPALEQRLRGAASDSEAQGAGPFEQRVSGRTVDRGALLGDAAGYVDAITGEGLSLALVAAQTLGKLLPDALAKGATRAALAPYERFYAREFRRYAAVTRAVIAIARRPRLRRSLVHLLAARPQLFSHLLGWVMRSQPPRALLSESLSPVVGSRGIR